VPSRGCVVMYKAQNTKPQGYITRHAWAFSAKAKRRRNPRASARGAAASGAIENLLKQAPRAITPRGHVRDSVNGLQTMCNRRNKHLRIRVMDLERAE
jgi:hypothetical protein